MHIWGDLLWRKFKTICPYFYLSVVLAFVVRTVFEIDNAPMLHKILLLINEILLLQAAGFGVYAVTGSAWYLSAMFLGIGILFPLVKNFGDSYNSSFAFIVSALILGALSSSIGHTSNPGYMINGIIFLGLLKGIAEISLGCFAYFVVHKVNSLKIGNNIKTLLTLLKYICFIFVIYFATLEESNSYLMFSCVGILFIGIVLSFSNITYNIINKFYKLTNLLGQFSLSIYLNNYYWALIIGKVFNNYSNNQKLIIYIIIVFISSIIINILAKLLKTKLGY